MLKLNPAFTNLNLYDFYKGEIQNNSMHRAVAVITSKQMVFYAQLEPDKEIDKESHAKIATLLHNQLEPGVDKCFPLGDFDGDAHIFSAGKYVIIDLPNNGQLSKMQAYFIITILNQFKKLNTRVANGENKINIFFCSYNPKYKEAKFNPYDINAMKSAVLHSITPNFMVHEEKIIGKTLPDERVLDSLRFHLNIRKHYNKNNANNFKARLFTCFYAGYFHKYMQALFPNYEEDDSIGAISSHK